MVAWGRNRDGQLGQRGCHEYMDPHCVYLPFKVKDVACGERHTAVLDLWGYLFICGINGNFEPCRRFKKRPTDGVCSSVSASVDYTAVALKNGAEQVIGDPPVLHSAPPRKRQCVQLCTHPPAPPQQH